MPSKRNLIHNIESHASRLELAAAAAKFWSTHWLEHVDQDHQHRIAQAEAHYQEGLARVRSSYQKTTTNLKEEIPSVVQAAGFLAKSWEDASWQSWMPPKEKNFPPLVRIGELSLAGQWGSLIIPALVPLVGGRNILFKATGAAKTEAINAVQSLLLRLLMTIAPGTLRFTFIDPVGLGHNVAPFMHLADHDEDLISGKAWTEPQHIEQRLADLTEHMENMIQKYLRNQFTTIEEYNSQAGEVAEPYHLLVVMDFPVNFSEVAAQRLTSIAQNGPRCGVYSVILSDTQKPLPHDFGLADLERTATIIAWRGEGYAWLDSDFRECPLKLDTPPDTGFFDRVLKSVGEAAKEASKVEVPFERIAPLREKWWTSDSRTGIHIPLGPTGARKLQYLDLGQGTAQHVLIVGKTGSGKSTLLHTLITNLSLAYSPEEVELHLVDFKKGVEFKTYAIHQLPHARVIAIESEREFGLSVIQGLDSEIKRRGDLFRAIGVDSLADYRRRSNQVVPRILLLVDEFQEFFIEDDAIASQAAQILDRLVRQGRAFGIHVLLGSQTLAGAYTLARSTIGQMAVRIALQCSEADSRLILADDNPTARLLSRPGEAIYNAVNGLIEGNNRFQVAWLPDDKHDQYMKRVQSLAQERSYLPPQPQIVFEGNAPAEAEKNRSLQDLLDAPGRPTPSSRAYAWLGEPVAIRESVAAHFRRQGGSNLLIVGRNREAALGMMSVSLISLAAQSILPEANGEAVFYVLDFSNVDSANADLFARLAEHVPHPVKVGRHRQLSETINSLVAEVQQRLDTESSSKPPIYLFIYGLQRARDLRQEEGLGFTPFGSEEPAAPSSAQQFATIIREGPDVGIHTLIWCDNLNNLNRTLDRRALREFEMRVVFQMSAENSANLIDTPAANKLGLYRALFYSEDEGRLEKFRPYGLPSAEWLARAGEQLCRKFMA